MKASPLAICPLLLLALLGGCGKKEASLPQTDPGTLITLSKVTQRDIPILLDSVGRITANTAPEISAEVEGRVIAVLHDAGDRVQAGTVLAQLETTQLGLDEKAAAADFARVDAQIAQDRRTLERSKELFARGFVSRNALDAATTQLDAQTAAGNAAQARLASSSNRLAKAAVLAPVSGTLESRKISVGDYIKVGVPLFKIAQSGALRAQLPFPEVVARHLKAGQKARLVSPIEPDLEVNAIVKEVRPMVGEGSRAVTAVVDFDNPGSWRAGATITGYVQVAMRKNALLVPESSVVRRPAGEVVYTVQGGKAHQVPVRTGERVGDMVEILAGLNGPETVAAEGAAYLSDGAAVRVAKGTQ